MTLAKYNTKNGSPNDRRKRRLEELRAVILNSLWSRSECSSILIYSLNNL